MLRLRLYIFEYLINISARLYVRPSRFNAKCIDALIAILAGLTTSLLRTGYPTSPLLQVHDENRSVAVHNYVRAFVRYLAIIAYTPAMQLFQIMSVFRNYDLDIDAEIERHLLNNKPLLLFTYHRLDLPDIVASLGAALARDPRFVAPRIIVVRKLSVEMPEVVWACLADLIGCKLNILSTQQDQFQKRLRAELTDGSIFICACDVPAGRISTQWSDTFSGMSVHTELGLLKYLASLDIPLAYIAADQNRIRLRYVPYQGENRNERFRNAAAQIIDLAGKDNTASKFNWVGWIEHLESTLDSRSKGSP